ncbi:MAG: carboxypeptidase-like regulatory domain-containing protein [Blastocatellia bacterium]
MMKNDAFAQQTGCLLYVCRAEVVQTSCLHYRRASTIRLFRGCVFLLHLLLLAVLTTAQTPPPPVATTTSMTFSMGSSPAPAAAWTGKRGTLAGHIVGDDGQPLANVGVSVASVTPERSARRQAITDDEGNFKINDLPVGAYRISPAVPGYVNPDGGEADSSAPSRAVLYRVGESATITMVKGGVITGKAVDSAGQPLVAAVVTAYRVRDGDGRRAASSATWRGLTDDRGIYRIFGLPSGAYLVATDGSGNTPTSAREVATYYPAATRDTAQEVAVSVGAEATGVDIRHRGELGHAVSGTVAGHQESRTPFGAAVTVDLLQATTGLRLATAYVYPMNGNGFVLYGVPDGEYEIVASQQATGTDASRSTSAPRRITVKGGDVTGLELRLTGLGAIAGRVVIEKLDVATTCAIKAQGGPEETLLRARREEKESRRFSWADGLPNEKGEFRLAGLIAGQYRLTPQLPSEHWYVKAMTLPGAKTAANKTTNAANGITVKGGEQVNDLLVTLAEGAAELRGRLTGKSLAPRMRVHLVPAEKDAADAVLRYDEVVARDGNFTFAHLAPGKYWLLARAVPADESDEQPAPPVAWDAAARARLRSEAEAANKAVELSSCQRVRDFVVTVPEKKP